MTKKKPNLALAATALQEHFPGLPLESLVSSNRTFPITSRVDLQRALDQVFQDSQTKLHGLHARYAHETITVAHLLITDQFPVVLSPIQQDDVDCGDAVPTRCLQRALWLAESDGIRFACLLGPAVQFGRGTGIHFEITVPAGEEAAQFVNNLFAHIQKKVHETASYRGKVISLEFMPDFSGTAGNIRVHKLPRISRENVILPTRTLELLERNVTGFAQQRTELQRLGLPVKKGLLFYGPPGTGKTYTIQYLATQLPDHTTLLITAEHVALLDQYFQLARHLQPAVIVLEDVDLIGRARETMDGACEESMLNKLLNEMDGLREDAEIFFVLTTNRPEQLEAALASRPGRIDQAIEFPLPDEVGRRQLIRLYSRGLVIADELAQTVVKKTSGVSAAFIKELMRRSAQFYLQAKRTGDLTQQDVDDALDEMLFAGGSLNRKLLGAFGSELSH
ncbi:AAA family ATPase [Edaphobacter bradus]|uniref:AAA family ATPase n=1 Tax=Edaphobacter bradus TaxID=2259016 RepID=UPI0021DF9F3C|nr:ATP-binding protein [Edaphobacter bradus]